ncbi:hypothetical protein V2J09_013965 [Rumex salicifolius]
MGFGVFILLPITTLLLMIGEQASAQPPTQPLYYDNLCVTTQGNYTANSTYETNLKTVLSDLQDHASSEIFYNSTAGSGSTTVYGQYFCRGDVNSTMCGACIQQAAESLLANCTLVKGGIMWYQQCTLRYSNASMVGIEAEYPRAWYNDTNGVGDPDKLASVLDSTINKFCSPDLNATQCDTCLRSTYAFIPSCCVGMAKQVAIFYASCQLRYSTYGAFYSGATTTTTTPPPPATSTPLPPSLTGSGTTPTPNTTSNQGTS